MPIAADDLSSPAALKRPYRAATDPVEPIHDYTLPIPASKQPPTRADFPNIRRRRRPLKQQQEQAPQTPAEEQGHVDDYV